MSDQKNTIILNGKHYDAVSGKLLESAQRVGRVVDNVVQAAHQATKPAKPVHHRPASHSTQAPHHKPQHTQTLMRHVVHKPQTGASHTATHRFRPPVSSERLARAAAIPKSKSISRFGSGSSAISEPTLVKKTAQLHVQTAPAEQHSPVATAAAAITNTEDFLTNALSRATSHEQKLSKDTQRRHKRLGMNIKAFNVSAAIAVVIVLGGFVAYQNMSYVSMRLASAKAGMSGTLPGYQPAGFALNHSISSQPGQITLNFHSNSDSRSFHITQAVSDWDSQTLMDSYVSSVSSSHQSVNEPNGQIVYLYGNANATWVNGGVWYRVEGNSALSSTQLLKLANSL